MDPQPVIPLEYAKEGPSLFWDRVVRWMTPAAWVAALLAWGLIWYETESVLFTGPVLFSAGLVMVISEALARRNRGAILLLGAGHVGICLLFVGLVNLLSWGPGEARWPFLVMGALYVIASGTGTLLVLLGPTYRRGAKP